MRAPEVLRGRSGDREFQGVRGEYIHLPFYAVRRLLPKHVGPAAMGYTLYRLMGRDSVEVQVGMIVFSLSASTAIYVLSSQLNSDAEFATSVVVLSTVGPFFSLSVALQLWLRSGGLS